MLWAAYSSPDRLDAFMGVTLTRFSNIVRLKMLRKAVLSISAIIWMPSILFWRLAAV